MAGVFDSWERFERVRLLGEGASGSVWLLRDRRLPSHQIACKELSRDEPRDESELRREFAMLRSLRHPGLVQVHEFVSPPDRPASFSMEYIEGLDLANAVRQEGADLWLTAAAEALRALAFLHDFGILHGDLKPANLLVRNRPRAGSRLVILDFGLARSAGPDNASVGGTLPYMAPEVLYRGDLTRRSDLYSLGALLHEAIHGAPPFPSVGRDLSRFIEAVREGRRAHPPVPGEYPTGVSSWIDELLSPDPSMRPATAGEALARLSVAAGQNIPPETRMTRAARLASGAPCGREDEQDRLRERVGPGKGSSVVLLTGPPGSGKSRILSWLHSESIREGWRVMTDPFARDAGDSAQTTEETLRALRRGAEESPTLLLLDDLQDSPGRVIGLVDRIGREPNRNPLQVIATVRDAEASQPTLARLLSHAGLTEELTRVALQPLDRDQVARIAVRACGDGQVSDERIDWLQEESEGNALVLESLLVDEAWETREPGARSALADSVDRWVGFYPSRHIAWLRALAILGRDAPSPQVEELSGLSGERSLEALREAVALGLATEARGVLSPASGLIASSVLASMKDAERRDLARRAADLVEQKSGSRAGGKLARLWQAAGDTGKSIRWCIGVAETSSDAEVAAGWYRKALEQLDRRDPSRVDLRSRHVRALIRAGHHAEAARALATVVRFTGDDAERGRWMAIRSQQLTLAGRAAPALALAEQTKTLAQDGGFDTVLALACRAAGQACFMLDHLDRAANELAEAAERLEGGEDARDLAEALQLLGLVRNRLRQDSEARGSLERALSLARDAGDVALVSRALIALATLERRLGRNADAWRIYGEARQHVERHGRRAQRLLLLQDMAFLALEQGQLDRAVGLSRETLSVALHNGDRDKAIFARLMLAEALNLAGRPSEAAGLLQGLLVDDRGYMSPLTSHWVKLTLAEALLQATSPDAARIRGLIAEARASSSLQPALGLAADAIALEATLLLAPAEFESEWEGCGFRESTFEGVAENRLVWRAWMARAASLLADGDTDRALEQAMEAATRSEEAEQWDLAARARGMVGDTHRKAGNGADADHAFELAAGRLKEAADRIRDPEMRRDFLDRPVFRAIRRNRPTITKTREDRLLAIYEMIRALNSESDPDGLLEKMLDMALRVVQAERGLILLRARDPDEYEVRLARNLEQQTIEDAAEFSKSVVQRATSGKPVLALDAGEDERLSQLKSVSLYGIRSVLCVPLCTRGKVIGAVYLDSRTEGALFSPEDMRFLEAFADNAALALENAQTRRDLETENLRLQVAAEARVSFGDILGQSAPMQGVYDMIQKVAESHLPVLILGESGTGKELVARAIHFRGVRRGGAYLTENCAAIPETLLESEVFGHVKGAFTGAERDHMGLFEQAHNGTLFLDEIGDMPVSMQARLLRVLQEGELRRVGGDRQVRVDVRVLAATHRDLPKEVESGGFRADLLYRLQVLVIELPPLRQRPGDIALLTDHFLQRISAERGRKAPGLRVAVMDLFERYHWPGNVRQLENTVQRLALLAGESPISTDVVESDRGLRQMLIGESAAREPMYSLEASQKERIRQALRAAEGNRTRAAKLLGISRATIFRKIKEYGL